MCSDQRWNEAAHWLAYNGRYHRLARKISPLSLATAMFAGLANLAVARCKDQEEDGAEYCDAGSKHERCRKAAGAIDQPTGNRYAKQAGQRSTCVADPIEHISVPRSNVEAIGRKSGLT